MKIELNDYPELQMVHDLLHEIPKGVIAGGLPRDLMTGKDFTDIDVFVSVDDMSELFEYSKIITRFADANKLSIGAVKDYDNGGSIVRVTVSNIDISFISNEMSDIKTLLKSFDLVSSQAWMVQSPIGFEVKVTDKFTEMDKHKVLGFYPKKCRGSYSHIEKVRNKYPDYLVVELADEVVCPF